MQQWIYYLQMYEEYKNSIKVNTVPSEKMLDWSKSKHLQMTK